MHKLIQQNRWFLIPFILCWISGITLQIILGKADAHIALNGYHTTALDTFFRYFTEVGGWIPAVVAILITLFISLKWGSIMAINLSLASLFTAALKQLFRMPRPRLFFENIEELLPLVDGVRLHSTLSFPSGHTTASFALFFSLALMTKRPWLKALCFIGAALGAYSRIYLSQHFLEDILAGSLIATVITLCCSTLLIPKKYGTNSTIGYLKQWTIDRKKS